MSCPKTNWRRTDTRTKVFIMKMKIKRPEDVFQAQNEPDGGKMEIFHLDANNHKGSGVTRRDFLRISGVVAATALLNACVPPTLASPTPTCSTQPVEFNLDACSPVRAHTGDILALVYSPSGKLLASSSRDSKIKVWSSISYEYLQAIDLGEDLPDNVPLAFISEQILAYGVSGNLKLWDIQNKEQIGNFGTKYGLSYLGVSASTGQLAYNIGHTDYSYEIGLLDLATLTEKPALESQNAFKAGLALSPDGKLLAVMGDANFELWDISTGRMIASAYNYDTNIFPIASNPTGPYPSGIPPFSPDGSLLFYSSNVWNVAEVQADGSLANPISTSIKTLSNSASSLFSPDGRYLISMTPRADDPWARDLNTYAWNATGVGNPITTVNNIGDTTALAFSPDGRDLLLGNNQGDILILEYPSLKPATCLFDAAASGGYVIYYKRVDSDGITRTYAQNGKSGKYSMPAGTICVCNTVAGSTSYGSEGSGGGGGGGEICTCNQVCVCEAV